MRETNLHHHFWTRSNWTERKVNKLIRDHPLSKSEMVVGIHNELHRYVEPVQAPVTREMGERVLWLIRDMPSYYTPIDASKSLREELYDTDAEYIAEQLNRQIPFLELSARALKQTII